MNITDALASIALGTVAVCVLAHVVASVLASGETSEPPSSRWPEAAAISKTITRWAAVVAVVSLTMWVSVMTDPDQAGASIPAAVAYPADAEALGRWLALVDTVAKRDGIERKIAAERLANWFTLVDSIAKRDRVSHEVAAKRAAAQIAKLPKPKTPVVPSPQAICAADAAACDDHKALGKEGFGGCSGRFHGGEYREAKPSLIEWLEASDIPGTHLLAACLIVLAESNGDPKAINRHNANGTTDAGLAMLNSGNHGWMRRNGFDPSRFFEPTYNLDAAWAWAKATGRAGCEFAGKGQWATLSLARRNAPAGTVGLC